MLREEETVNLSRLCDISYDKRRGFLSLSVRIEEETNSNANGISGVACLTDETDVKFRKVEWRWPSLLILQFFGY